MNIVKRRALFVYLIVCLNGDSNFAVPNNILISLSKQGNARENASVLS